MSTHSYQEDRGTTIDLHKRAGNMPVFGLLWDNPVNIQHTTCLEGRQQMDPGCGQGLYLGGYGM